MFKRLAVLTVALGMVNAQASQQDLEKYLSIGSVKTEIETITADGSSVSVMEQEVAPGLTVADLPGVPVNGQVVAGEKQTIGEVIAVANEVIAFGERVYEIVKKGKPVLNMSYEPISVLPKQNGRAVDTMDMEGWSMPVGRKIRMVYKNLYGMEVVTFDYTVIFAYGGSLDGKGAYITAAQITPSNVNVSWGYTMNATMKLIGLQNHGTKASPVAGAVLNLNYKVETVLKTIETNDTFHITGKGGFKQL